MAEDKQNRDEAWFLKSNFPVLFPSHPAFAIASADELEVFLRNDLTQRHGPTHTVSSSLDDSKTDTNTFTMVSTPPSTAADIRGAVDKMNIGADEDASADEEKDERTDADITAKPGRSFMAGLLSQGREEPVSLERRMLTENADLAYTSTGEALVDLFSELEDLVTGPRLRELLEVAWKDDPMVTLKIIFNARSIHLGKASRQTFYRCAGWLAKQHPLTLVVNLPWLSRPIIQKKLERKDESKPEDDEMVLVEPEKDENDPARFDVRNGVAHGYWKDLLNTLVLHVNGKLDVLANPRDILNIEQEKDQQQKKNFPDYETAKALRHEKRDARHEAAIKAFNEDPVYRDLHIAIARLFARQLTSDLALLRGSDNKAKRGISLCAKWAPSNKLFHDKHTFIVSSIAEIMHPASEFVDTLGTSPDRELYLRHAREAYRKDVSSLRKQHEIVEHNLTNKTYPDIKYERVPSVAMNNYSPIFAAKDTERFEQYIDKVADGKAKISGATLLPSTLMMTLRQSGRYLGSMPTLEPGVKRSAKDVKKIMEAKMMSINAKVLDGQWNALVQRIKDSGTLESSIAVADVSGSMTYPVFPDGSCPMDSSIGLALLIAEVTKPPFGGAFITFSARPTVQKIDGNLTLAQKYERLASSDWEMNTDFVAVFDKLILPMAIKHELKQEDMVKRVFVFSDMQFDAADYSSHRWSSSYERIQKKYEQAGYEMPELIFWNLAGGRAGYGGGGEGNPIAPKPVTAGEKGTALVSGYSQGLLKVFLDNGSFEEPEEEVVEEEEEEGEAGDKVTVVSRKKQKIDPLVMVKKAISHKAYGMLRVVD